MVVRKSAARHALDCSSTAPVFLPQKPLLEDSEQCAVILNATAPFQFQNSISDLVPGCFYYFVIKPPGTVVIGSFDFSAFSGLVLGFGLFQLSP
jgi:hypothetical protein